MQSLPGISRWFEVEKREVVSTSITLFPRALGKCNKKFQMSLQLGKLLLNMGANYIICLSACV